MDLGFLSPACVPPAQVVCGNCSQWKTYLTYMNRSERVCEDCYNVAKRRGMSLTILS